MLKCWEENPSDRPTFAELKNTMKEMERNHRVMHLEIPALKRGADFILSLFCFICLIALFLRLFFLSIGLVTVSKSGRFSFRRTDN